MKSKHGIVLTIAMFLAGFSAAETIEQLLQVKPSPRTPTRRVRTAKPVDQSDSLKAINDCEELRSFFIDVAVEKVLEYRYNQWRWIAWSGGPEPSGGAEDVPTDFTTTNNQEEGVDELDIVKTDGNYLYVTQQGAFHILRTWPVESTAEVSALPLDRQAAGLFVHGDRAALFSHRWESLHDNFWAGETVTRLDLADITDRGQPAVVRSLEVQGRLHDARRIEGDVYAVIQSYIQEPEEVWSPRSWQFTDFQCCLLSGAGGPIMTSISTTN